MALNKNHEYEDLDGVRCGIVERNVKPERLSFLKDLLELNGYTVVAVASPPPKVAAPPKPTEGETAEAKPEIAPAPETYTVGVTDYTFNPVNAIFGRQLKSKNGTVVTMAYWNQTQETNDDSYPYFDSKENWK